MSALVGTGALIRLALRLDRVRLPIWIIALAGVAFISASSFAELYPTPESRKVLAASVTGNPAMIAMIGPAFDLSSIGGLVAWRTGATLAILVALMSLLTVARHTRAEEEAGRLELLGSTVVGRFAPLTAAMIVALLANLAIAALVALGLIKIGLPTTGSLALALSFALVGLVFAAIAAVAAQLTENGRTAIGIASTALGLAYLLRGIGDSAGESGPTWLSWLSPLGWAQQVRPFAGDRWLVFGLGVAGAILFVAAAYTLVTRRDVGAGLFPTRLGPASASATLRGPFALAWRLHRGPLLGWSFGFLVYGLAIGSVTDSMVSLVESNPQMKEIFIRLGGAQGIVDAYFSAIFGILGLVASVYAIQATLRLRTEETSLRAEPVLATRVGRTRWTFSHITLAFVGAAVVLAAGGLGTGLAHGMRTADLGGELTRLVGGALVQLPAALVLAGIAVAMFGLAPRLTVISWSAVMVCLVIGQLGPMLRLDQWAMDISPFTHLPKLPGGEFTAVPLLWLTAVTAALTALGVYGFRHRDLG